MGWNQLFGSHRGTGLQASDVHTQRRVQAVVSDSGVERGATPAWGAEKLRCAMLPGDAQG